MISCSNRRLGKGFHLLIEDWEKDVLIEDWEKDFMF